MVVMVILLPALRDGAASRKHLRDEVATSRRVSRGFREVFARFSQGFREAFASKIFS